MNERLVRSPLNIRVETSCWENRVKNVIKLLLIWREVGEALLVPSLKGEDCYVVYYNYSHVSGGTCSITLSIPAS